MKPRGKGIITPPPFYLNLNLINKKPLAQRGSDVEVPTMDDRQEIDLKSSVPVKRQYVKA